MNCQFGKFKTRLLLCDGFLGDDVENMKSIMQVWLLNNSTCG